MNDDEHRQQSPLGALVDHITSTHHAYLNRQLALLARLLTDHARAYWRQHPELLKAHEVFYHVQAVAEEHLIHEETAAFLLIHAHEVDPCASLTGFASSMDAHVEVDAGIEKSLGQVRGLLLNHHVRWMWRRRLTIRWRSCSPCRMTWCRTSTGRTTCCFRGCA